jgi:hypothetical protein
MYWDKPIGCDNYPDTGDMALNKRNHCLVVKNTVAPFRPVCIFLAIEGDEELKKLMEKVLTNLDLSKA